MITDVQLAISASLLIGTLYRIKPRKCDYVYSPIYRAFFVVA